MLELHDQIQEAATALQKLSSQPIRAGVILGTGLGNLVERMEDRTTVEYGQIPHFLASTAISHAGKLHLGTLEGVPIAAMEGRFHMYEGYPLKRITFPVRVMKALGADLLVVTNAAGGMNPHYRGGDIVVIEDHINLMGDNPLIGINDDRLGPRFPDMSQPYDRALIDVAMAAARKGDIRAHEGVFVAVAGPNLETRAEYRFLRLIGADVVGMSTVPEVLTAIHGGMKCVGFSVVTDMCLPDALAVADVAEIIKTANEAGPRLASLIAAVLRQHGEVPM